MTYCNEWKNLKSFKSLDECKNTCAAESTCNGCTYSCTPKDWRMFSKCTEKNSGCGSNIDYIKL